MKSDFESLNLITFIRFLTQLKALEDLSLHCLPDFFSEVFCLVLLFYFATQLRKLNLDRFVLHSFVSEKLKDWPNLEDISLICCTYLEQNVEFDFLSEVLRLELCFNQVHQLTELISHPGCRLKIVDVRWISGKSISILF